MSIDKIAHNQARRATSKLILNSLWGRFCLRERLPITELVSEPEDFARFIFGNGYVIKHFSFVSDSVALIQWTYPDKVACATRNVNVFIGAFTTAYARLELYDLLDKLGERVVYVDTDTIFLSKTNDWMPETSSFLGDLTNELDPDDYITEFSSAGPKSYGFRTAKGKV
ncbi:MAG: DNA polymerase, partial [Cetobacterium sp.]